jgi:uncharacterized cofD-like protein
MSSAQQSSLDPPPESWAGEPRVVAVGGGHGLARALSALRLLGARPTAVITVADDGGSSGRLREELGIIALGDLRRALLTLARNRALAGVLAHRFQRGQLQGHALGNLWLLALAERNGMDFVRALDIAGQLLDCAGRVLPSTTEPVRLMARVSGQEVSGQARVTKGGGRVERVWLDPAAPHACDEAVAALRAADLVVLGPGSLFTSVIAALLVPGLRAAVTTPSARPVYVANLLTQPGETAGRDARAHVEALLEHVPGLVLHAVVLHDGPPPEGPGEPIVGDLEGVLNADTTVVRADLASRTSGLHDTGHDPARLARALRPLLERSFARGGGGTASGPGGVRAGNGPGTGQERAEA